MNTLAGLLGIGSARVRTSAVDTLSAEGHDGMSEESSPPRPDKVSESPDASQQLRIYGFRGKTELLHGWQAHAKKQQIIHERSARRIQHWHYLIGGLAVVFASFAGSSAVAAWQTQNPSSALAIFSAVIATGAAVSAGVVTFLDLGGRAERHRKAAADYKQALRTLEAVALQD